MEEVGIYFIRMTIITCE